MLICYFPSPSLLDPSPLLLHPNYGPRRIPTCHVPRLVRGDACAANAAMNLHPWTVLASNRQQTEHGMSLTHCVEGRAPRDRKDSSILAFVENQVQPPNSIQDQRVQWVRDGSGLRLKEPKAQLGTEAKTASNTKARVG